MKNEARFTRRTFIATLPPFIAARDVLAAAGVEPGRLGICSFSCNRVWQAVRDKTATVPFTDGPSFYDYARSMGADGVQTSVATLSEALAVQFRQHVERTDGYFEGDVRLPQKASDLERFEQEVTLTLTAGGSVARTVLSGSRRYETWKTLGEFQSFYMESAKRLTMAEPILRRHQLRLAVENHKDLTAQELAALMRGINSEWIGVNIDTGNNLALLDDPYDTIEALAPFAMSVHLKDMAVQPIDSGFRLSEVPCGSGFLDLPRIVTVLRAANPELCFNLEMATRDPLVIPCANEEYWTTFLDRRTTHLAAAKALIASHPIRKPPPTIIGKTMTEQMKEEEVNNVASLRWMHDHLKQP